MKSKCLDIFQIKYNEKLYGIYELSQYCKKKNLIINEEIKQANIIYNNIEMSYEEYQNDLKINAKKFKVDKVDINFMLSPEVVYIYDTKLYVSICFVNTLCTNITAGNHYALESYDKIPQDLYGIKSYTGCFFRRGLDFSTSILWYNTATDYFLQIFCSRFNLYKYITNKNVELMSFEKISKLCGYNKIAETMNTFPRNKENSEMFRWWEKIQKCFDKLSWIRKRCNSLKHKSGVTFNKLDFNFIEIQKGNQKMSDAYTSLSIDIDRDFIQLINAHNEIVKLYSYMVRKINEKINIKKLEWHKKIE